MFFLHFKVPYAGHIWTIRYCFGLIVFKTMSADKSHDFLALVTLEDDATADVICRFALVQHHRSKDIAFEKGLVGHI